jgi:glycerophosphoryl diester phosphodiesterase
LLLDTLWPGWLDQALALDCRAVIAHFSVWNEATVSEAHQAGLRCLSYTVNDETTAQHLLELGTDGIITDRVDLFRPD